MQVTFSHSSLLFVSPSVLGPEAFAFKGCCWGCPHCLSSSFECFLCELVKKRGWHGGQGEEKNARSWFRKELGSETHFPGILLILELMSQIKFCVLVLCLKKSLLNSK